MTDEQTIREAVVTAVPQPVEVIQLEPHPNPCWSGKHDWNLIEKMSSIHYYPAEGMTVRQWWYCSICRAVEVTSQRGEIA